MWLFWESGWPENEQVASYNIDVVLCSVRCNQRQEWHLGESHALQAEILNYRSTSFYIKNRNNVHRDNRVSPDSSASVCRKLGSWPMELPLVLDSGGKRTDLIFLYAKMTLGSHRAGSLGFFFPSRAELWSSGLQNPKLLCAVGPSRALWRQSHSCSSWEVLQQLSWSLL